MSNIKNTLARQIDTREKIVDLAETLIRLCGYSTFSYHDISSRLNMKNAAVHYHYSTKEELGVAVIRRYIDRFSELKLFIHNSAMGEWEELLQFIDGVFGRAVEESKVCLVGALSTEFVVLPEKMKMEFQRMVHEIEEWLTELLKRGKRKKIFHFNTTAETKALMIITNMMAGLQVSRVSGKDCFYKIREGVLKELKPE